MRTKELTRIAFMAAILVCVFQMFAQILYLEMITFTIVVFSCNFSRKEAVMACLIFGMVNMLFIGITPWTLMYVLIYPCYAWIVSLHKLAWWQNHPLMLYLLCGFLSFLTGQLLDLPFLLFSGKITIIYILMGIKTSVIQGILSFLACMFLFDPVTKRLQLLLKE